MAKGLIWEAVLALATSTFAADGKSVSYQSGDETVRALLYTGRKTPPTPGS